MSQLYPNLPTAPNLHQFHINTIKNELNELIKLKENFFKKYKRQNKILNKLIIFSSVASAVSISSTIGSIASFSTIIGIPISISLGSASLGSSISVGIIAVFIKKYKSKLKRVIKLCDSVTTIIQIFENSISKSVNDNQIDINEFELLQKIYYQGLEKIVSIDRKLGLEARNQFEKSLMLEIQNIKKTQNQQNE